MHNALAGKTAKEYGHTWLHIRAAKHHGDEKSMNIHQLPISRKSLSQVQINIGVRSWYGQLSDVCARATCQIEDLVYKAAGIFIRNDPKEFQRAVNRTINRLYAWKRKHDSGNHEPEPNLPHWLRRLVVYLRNTLPASRPRAVAA